jgi:hypothetical protein
VNPAHLVLTTQSDHARYLGARRAPIAKCIHGHVIAEVGRTKGGLCKACQRFYSARSYRRKRDGDSTRS